MRRSAGFNLIELLVAIDINIIARLMSILAPTLSKARERAHAVTCRANLEGHGARLRNTSTRTDSAFPAPGRGADPCLEYDTSPWPVASLCRRGVGRTSMTNTCVLVWESEYAPDPII